MPKPKKLPTKTAKIFKGTGKLSNLTFGDIGSLMRRLSSYKKDVPKGFKKGPSCHVCIKYQA